MCARFAPAPASRLDDGVLFVVPARSAIRITVRIMMDAGLFCRFSEASQVVGVDPFAHFQVS